MRIAFDFISLFDLFLCRHCKSAKTDHIIHMEYVGILLGTRLFVSTEVF